MKALVRVAKKKSNLKFNQLKAYRAINLSDMYVLLNKYSDIDMLIFEEIQPDEIDAVKMLASEFSGKTYTFGQIKLDGIENYTCLSDIQDALDTTYSLETRTYGRERAPLLFTDVYNERGELYIESVPVLEIEDKSLLLDSEDASENKDTKGLDDIIVADTDSNINITEEVIVPTNPFLTGVVTPTPLLEPNFETNIDSDSGSEEVAKDIFYNKYDVKIDEATEEKIVIDISLKEDKDGKVIESVEVDNDIFAGLDDSNSNKEDVNSEIESDKVNKEAESEEVDDDIFARIEESKKEDEIKSEEVDNDIFALLTDDKNNVNTEGVMTEDVNTEELNTEEFNKEVVSTEEITSEDVQTGAVHTEEVKTEEVNINREEIITEDVITEEVRTEEVKTEEVETEEVKTEEVETEEVETDNNFVNGIGFKKFEFEPILDLERLNNFNSLIESDRDLVKTMFSELMYYRESLSKLSSSEVVLRVNSLNNQLISYQSRIKELENEVILAKNDNSKLLVLEEKLNFESDKFNKLKEQSLKEIEEIRISLKTEQENVLRLTNEKSELIKLFNSEKKTLEESLSSAKKEIEGLESRVKEAGETSKTNFNQLLSDSQEKERSLISKYDNLYDSYILLMDSLNLLSKKYMNLFENHNKEVSKVQTILDNYKTVLAEKIELEEKYTDLELESKLAKNKLSETERIANTKLNEFSKSQEILQDKLTESLNTQESLSLEIENLKIRLESSDRQKQKAVSQVDDLLRQINDKNTIIESKEALVSNLEKQLAKVKEERVDVVDLKEQVKVSDIATQELQKEIGRLQILTREQIRDLDAKDKRIGELNKANSDLKSHAQALSRSITSGSKLELNCRYSGRGFILPVFGSGSYGVTTTAVSLAKKLFNDGANVLLMDLDLVSPKCNSYLGISPLLSKEIGAMTGLPSQLQYTCMGILIQKDTDYFIRERSNFIQQIYVNKRTNKHLDFFGGLFGDVEVYKFANINWDELMNTLGNQYDYIVLDLGRFGGSNEQNALIKMFATLSLRYLAVTTKDKDDIRNMILKIDSYKLDRRNLVWLLNMADDTREDDFILKALGQIPHRIITFNDGIFGKKDKGLFTDTFFKSQFNSVADLLTMKDIR